MVSCRLHNKSYIGETLFRSRWLHMDLGFVSGYKHVKKKRSWSVSRHLDRTTLVNTLWYEIFADWWIFFFFFFWGLREQSFAARIDWNFRWELNFCGKITQSTENGRDKMWHLRDLRKWCPLAWPFEQVSNVIFWLLWVRFLCLRERKSIDLTFYRFLNATFFTPVSDIW